MTSIPPEDDALLAQIRAISVRVSERWFADAVTAALAQVETSGDDDPTEEPDPLLQAVGDLPGSSVNDDFYRSALSRALEFGLDEDDGMADVIDLVRFERTLSAAASGGGDRPEIEVAGGSGGLLARFDEDEEGRLQVSIHADVLERPLVALGVTTPDDEALVEFLTPLAATADGWGVRVDLGSVERFAFVDLAAPRWGEMNELTDNVIKRALGSARTYGIAGRAWRELVNSGELPTDQAQLADELLRRHDR